MLYSETLQCGETAPSELWIIYLTIAYMQLLILQDRKSLTTMCPPPGQIGLKFLSWPQPLLFVTVVANLNPYPSTAMAYLLKYQYIWNIDFCDSKILPNKYVYYLTIFYNNYQIENLHFQTESPFQVAIGQDLCTP